MIYIYSFQGIGTEKRGHEYQSRCLDGDQKIKIERKKLSGSDSWSDAQQAQSLDRIFRQFETRVRKKNKIQKSIYLGGETRLRTCWQGRVRMSCPKLMKFRWIQGFF